MPCGLGRKVERARASASSHQATFTFGFAPREGSFSTIPHMLATGDNEVPPFVVVDGPRVGTNGVEVAELRRALDHDDDDHGLGGDELRMSA